MQNRQLQILFSTEEYEQLELRSELKEKPSNLKASITMQEMFESF